MNRYVSFSVPRPLRRRVTSGTRDQTKKEREQIRSPVRGESTRKNHLPFASGANGHGAGRGERRSSDKKKIRISSKDLSTVVILTMQFLFPLVQRNFFSNGANAEPPTTRRRDGAARRGAAAASEQASIRAS